MNRRDELFAYLLKREGIERPAGYTIPLRDNDDAPPLSFSQERFWFLDQFEHGRPIYNGCKVIRLMGRLSIEVLAESLNLIARRHEIVRTTYPAPDGRPTPRIALPGAIELSLSDLAQVAESELPSAIERLARHEWMQPIDLSAELPLRVRLIRRDDNHHLLLLTLHQIAFDSQSVAIFFRELWSAYQAKLNGKEPRLASLPVQYADYASWQRRRVSSQAFSSQRQYWLQRLSGTLPVLHLPTDKARPAVQGFDGSRLSISLPETLQQKLKELSRENDVTLFVTLLTAFKVFLYRYTAEKDLLVGCPVLNRGLPEIEYLLGSFVNTVVLRTHFDGSANFRAALRRVRETSIGAFAHQEFPFEKLVEELQPQRDVSRNPIFQVMFAFQNTSVPALELAELRSETIEIDGGMTKFDLTFSLIDKEHGIAGHIEYSTDLFKRDTIERMTRQFQTLLEAIVDDPDRSIATLPILTEAERRQVLFEWNDTTVEYPKDKCIHQLFEEQVKRTPDAIAVEYENKRVTYQELNRKANQLAHYLIDLGIGPEKLVGICVERSIEMVIGLLGILKAGGAYVPLDPTYPEERLRFMLQNSQVSAVVTQQSFLDSAQLVDVRLDRDLPMIEQQSNENPTIPIDSHNLAYVIYTSGSTGTPKGVAIEHRNTVAMLHWAKTVFTSDEIAGLLASTSICFDLSVFELLVPISWGGKVILVESALSLRETEARGITLVNTVPSAMAALLAAGALADSVRVVNLAGEPLRPELVNQLYQTSTVEKVYDLYGPSETTTYSTFTLRTTDGPSTIGRPISNTQIYLLDSNLQLVPVGVTGELYIGGAGVARGYVNHPELTSEKFVANPFTDDPHSRLYRTGDRAKYLPDGNIELLGRTDNQVKIRGHRIELAEIEHILNQHPSVKESLVVAFDESVSESDNPKSKSGPADENPKSLVAYLVSDSEKPLATELRSFLSEKLPDYMIPSRFMFLDALPLTTNGKLDRNALPPPDGARPQLDQGFVEPRTEVEELIAQVWREILKLDKIGVHDNFFELGGHSLLATRVVARLRGSLNVDIALRKLFELPTVAELARHVVFLRHGAFGRFSIDPIVPVDRAQPLPLSFSQRRLWYLQKIDSNLSAYNIPAAFRVKGALDKRALEQALSETIARHEVLRAYVKEFDGQPRQEVLPSLRIAVPVIDLTHLSEEQAERETRRLFSADVRQLYDLANAPLMRAALLRRAVDDHVLILNFHHIIADGSSLAIFYRELGVLYAAARDGKTASLASLTVQYGDYAAWQQQWLKSSSFDSQLGYWETQLAGLPEPCALPADFDRPTTQSYRGAKVATRLSGELTAALKNLSRRQSVTMFMTLFATFNILLSRLSGQQDIIMGSTIAGRNHPATDGLIGFFINALPLRCDLSGAPSFVTLLQRVRELCLDAYANQDVPFEKIVEALRPRREPGRNPIFDLLFNVADGSERVLTLAGCEITKLAQDGPAAKFDIVLQAPEVDGKLELVMVYNSDLFRADRIVALLEQFAGLLSQVVDNPKSPIDQLSLVTDASRTVLPNPRQALNASWQGAIHELLAEQARRVPTKPAIVDPEQSWTYAELDRCANRFANDLVLAGIQPKDLIAIYARRGSALAIGLFGILKAGASFLILDPAYPAARTIDYLRMAQAKGWLQLDGSGDLPVELVNCLDSLPLRYRKNLPQSKAEILRSLSRCADGEPEINLSADDPAYVAFTSGSTGEPKGVVCRHGPITHFLPWQEDAFQLSIGDRFAMLSGLAYSHLHRDVFTALALGATLYIPTPSQARSPQQLSQWLERNAITILHLTPALGQLLLTSGVACLPALRRVFFGGDVLTGEMVARIRRLAPNTTVGSFYGATETQRAVGYFEISNSASAQADAGKTIPLDRGIKDVQLLVLNGARQLAGVGELGEIFVRSPHLAEGYIGDEKRTGQMFIGNPFTNDPQDRLYRTGELGRYLPDGNVEWAGRNDRRVNIRGFRVELEEIEIALKQHPTVKDAAVVLRDYEIFPPENSKLETRNPKRDQRLVAYVAAQDYLEPQSLADLLQSFLATRLPNYMVPGHFEILPSLPLGPNGKLDYRSLPEVRRSFSAGASLAPRGDVENKLCEIFAELLGRADVGTGENFFRIGGHSLLAARAAARIGDAFGVSLDLLTFLENPTVIGLAEKVNLLRATGQISAASAANAQREEFDL